jgi:hypothetical protein
MRGPGCPELHAEPREAETPAISSLTRRASPETSGKDIFEVFHTRSAPRSVDNRGDGGEDGTLEKVPKPAFPSEPSVPFVP